MSAIRRPTFRLPKGLLMSRSRWVCLAAALALTAGCGSGGSSTSAPASGGASSASSAVTGGVFRLVTADGSVKAFSLDDLKKLPLTSIMSNGQPQEGPALRAVLQAAGVTSFAQVKVTGTNGSATLTQAEVTKDVILDFNNRGKVKLVSPSMPKPKRIIDVITIEAR